MSESCNRATTQHWNSQDFEETLTSFREITTELNYKQAQRSLRHLVKNVDLSAAEREGLESEIDALTAMLEKLEGSVVQIAAFGLVGRGKSSVLNALLGEEVFQTGPLHGVTRSPQRARWELTTEMVGEEEVLRVSLPTPAQGSIQLVDTPGIDEVDGETRALLARQIAKQADLILFIIAGDITKVEFEALSQLREAGKPMLLVFNKIDQYPEVDRQAIYEQIRDRRVKELLFPEEIVMVAASPLVKQAIRRPDGSLGMKMVRGRGQIEPLKLKILEVLHREGKSLIALNSMLYADEVHDRLVERKLEIRARLAEETIQRAVMTKAIAVALNPVTVIDLLTGAVIDVATILSLSHVYGIAMSQGAAIALLQRIALSMGGIGASELVANIGLSSLKGLLGITVPATGGLSLSTYLSVAIAQAGVAGVSTYAIAKVTDAYLANGASWGPDGPKATIQRILDSLDEASILNRIKHELKAKLSVGRR